MGVKEYFFDTYALIELVKGNSKYISYIDSRITMTIFNLAELAYSFLSDYGKEKALVFCKRFKECVKEVDEDILLEAMEFKRTHKKQNLSYTDCIGYTFAKRHDLLFLTGDEQFRNLPHVEFIKNS